MFNARPIIAVEYEDLAASWARTLASIQAALGLDPIAVPAPYRKGTVGSMEQLILNYGEVRAHYVNHPVISAAFQASAAPAGVGRRR
jgi:hypothetical protein